MHVNSPCLSVPMYNCRWINKSPTPCNRALSQLLALDRQEIHKARIIFSALSRVNGFTVALGNNSPSRPMLLTQFMLLVELNKCRRCLRALFLNGGVAYLSCHRLPLTINIMTPPASPLPSPVLLLQNLLLCMLTKFCPSHQTTQMVPLTTTHLSQERMIEQLRSEERPFSEKLIEQLRSETKRRSEELPRLMKSMRPKAKKKRQKTSLMMMTMTRMMMILMMMILYRPGYTRVTQSISRILTMILMMTTTMTASLISTKMSTPT